MQNILQKKKKKKAERKLNLRLRLRSNNSKPGYMIIYVFNAWFPCVFFLFANFTNDLT